MIMAAGINWVPKYDSENSHIKVAGFFVESEEECRSFFIKRVSAKLAETDGAEELKQHLFEMETTGFDLHGLIEQVEASPQAKDWEIGEALAEVVLEDNYEGMFPWPTGFDKRAKKASLPGPDLVGFQRHSAPRFVFGQVKSSSEKRTPPQVINKAKDCLRNQMFQLVHCNADQQQLISWLLVRMRETDWEQAFNEALRRYSEGDFWLVGMLISGNRETKEDDLARICSEIDHQPGNGEVHLLGFYLPFLKEQWVKLIYDEEVST